MHAQDPSWLPTGRFSSRCLALNLRVKLLLKKRLLTEINFCAKRRRGWQLKMFNVQGLPARVGIQMVAGLSLWL